MKTSTLKNALLLLAGAAFFAASGVSAQPLKQMISPVSHPTNFEDPRHSTELRPIYIYHEIDHDFATEGGNVQITALQARFKLTDDFSIIATKDGYVDFNPHSTLNKSSGWANISAGAKYSPYRTDSSIVSMGLRYEIPVGEESVLQGQGDGLINPFVSAATTIENWNFMIGSGFRLRIDSSDSSLYDLDAHVSYKIGNFYPLVEFGLTHVMAAGNRLPIADEGQDFFDIGASESDGENITTMAVGARYRITDNLDFGAAYEFPLDNSSGTRIIEYRVTTDFIYRFSCT
ncbi:MAG: hypothetical protein J0M12_16910 [Deltaproteobacteria bacterium]|nr:hypothetical protein [Deltaproteobacteria bacterium]